LAAGSLEMLSDAQRFQFLLDALGDHAIIMLDPGGLVVSWNAGAQRITGYFSGEIVGRHFSCFFTPEERKARVPVAILRDAEREGRIEREGWRLRKDGSRFWASSVVAAIRDEEGAMLGFAEVTRDSTRRRAAEEALRESERQFRLLVEGVVDHAILMLDPDGRVVSWNAGAQRLTGYTADEILGRHFSHFYMEGDRAAELPQRALESAAREGRHEAEGWRLRRDGSRFWASVVISAIRDEAGALLGFAEIARDITDRRTAQITLQKARDERDRAQKMEALGKLTGGVAHDFNNILMIISGHAETLKQLVAGDPKGVRALAAIELAVQRGEALTRQLLSFARRQTLNPVVFEIGERIEAVRAMLASSFDASVKLVTRLPPDLWPVMADVNEFELALVNIAFNARDAMPQGGTITITAENVRLAPGEIAEDLEGEFVALTIADAGHGIPPDILSRVFDPFFTTKGSRGTGLGLSQVHGFAHQSGGTVAIDSSLETGTRVTLYLPRAAAAPARAAADPAPEACGSGTALLVEDNPEVAEVTAGLLEELGFRVQVAGNAQAALEAADSRGFDLLLSDIVMPGAMNGLALARTLRQRHPHLPIVLVTGYSDTAAAAEGEFAVLRKPYRLADLNRVLAEATAAARESAPRAPAPLRRPGRGSHPRTEPL